MPLAAALIILVSRPCLPWPRACEILLLVLCSFLPFLFDQEVVSQVNINSMNDTIFRYSALAHGYQLEEQPRVSGS
jgi:hypothetical protein